MFRELCPLLLGHNPREGVLVCGFLGSTPYLVPLSLDEMGAQQEVSDGPLNGHRLSLWWLLSVT